MLLQGLQALFAMFYMVFWKSVNPGFLVGRSGLSGRLIRAFTLTAGRNFGLTVSLFING